VALILGTGLLASLSLQADEIRVKLPAPPLPPVLLPIPPPMIWLPIPKVYVAHDSPYPVFYHQGHYYFHYERVWYLGPGYNGPWTTIVIRQLPPGLRGFRQERWHEYQREADRRFREDRDDDHYPFYAGHPGERAHWKYRDRSHDREGKGNRDGRGRGRDDD
jgi:hypothetical protein